MNYNRVSNLYLIQLKLFGFWYFYRLETFPKHSNLLYYKHIFPTGVRPPIIYTQPSLQSNFISLRYRRDKIKKKRARHWNFHNIFHIRIHHTHICTYTYVIDRTVSGSIHTLTRYKRYNNIPCDRIYTRETKWDISRDIFYFKHIYTVVRFVFKTLERFPLSKKPYSYFAVNGFDGCEKSFFFLSLSISRLRYDISRWYSFSELQTRVWRRSDKCRITYLFCSTF